MLCQNWSMQLHLSNHLMNWPLPGFRRTVCSNIQRIMCSDSDDKTTIPSQQPQLQKLARFQTKKKGKTRGIET